MLRKEYAPLLKDDPDARRDAEALAARTYELSQFLVRVAGVTRLPPAITGRVTYHDSCHLLRGLGEAEAPRTLLKNLDGVDLVELPGADQCCGFGGSFSVRLPEVSSAILDKKIAAIESTGAECLVACDAGCLMQIGGRLSRTGSRVRARHLAEVLSAR
jgi:L-lactate dehydrogenase complex protein LldE